MEESQARVILVDLWKSKVINVGQVGFDNINPAIAELD